MAHVNTLSGKASMMEHRAHRAEMLREQVRDLWINFQEFERAQRLVLWPYVNNSNHTKKIVWHCLHDNNKISYLYSPFKNILQSASQPHTVMSSSNTNVHCVKHKRKHTHLTDILKINENVNSFLSSLPSLQVHQAVLFLQPFPAAPVKNSHSLYYSVLT